MNPTIRKIGSKLAVAALYPSYHATGFCNVCVRHTLFVCDVAADRWIRRCCWCRSTPKYRAIARAIESESEGTVADYIRNHRVYELSTTSPIYRRLRGQHNYEASGYFADKPFGQKITAHYWNQDLHNLTFPSESFDLVISSETMEHVRRPWRAFAEIHRVLTTGGLYCFTIPFRSDRLTRSRVDTTGEKDVFLLEKVYHQDPYRPEDSLVYTDFGTDLPDLLRPIGFDTKLVPFIDMKCDIQDDLRPVNVFVARKRSVEAEDSPRQS